MTVTRPISQILVPIDFSESSEAALHYAVALAESFGASIEVFHAYEMPPMAGGELVLRLVGVGLPMASWIQERTLRDTEKFVATLDTQVPISTLIVEGRPVSSIRQRAESLRADLVVIAARGRSKVARVLLGSLAERVVRTAPCPVLTVRSGRWPVVHGRQPATFGSQTPDAFGPRRQL